MNLAKGILAATLVLTLAQVSCGEDALVSSLGRIDDGVNFVYVRPGTVRMYSMNKIPRPDQMHHRVAQISKPFYVCRYEVTVGQVLKWLNSPGIKFEPSWIGLDRDGCPIKEMDGRFVLNGESHLGKSLQQPMVLISWDGANAYCEWLSARDPGFRYRLPTEAEWEYFARASTTSVFPWGDEFDPALANMLSTSNEKDDELTGVMTTTEVGSYPSNNWGIHDTVGNVSEWCSDWYEAWKPGKIPEDKIMRDPIGPSEGSLKVVRGSSWGAHAHNGKSSQRNALPPDIPFTQLGFRVVAQRTGRE